jgi:hypothetical protein
MTTEFVVEYYDGVGYDGEPLKVVDPFAKQTNRFRVGFPGESYTNALAVTMRKIWDNQVTIGNLYGKSWHLAAKTPEAADHHSGQQEVGASQPNSISLRRAP